MKAKIRFAKEIVSQVTEEKEDRRLAKRCCQSLMSDLKITDNNHLCYLLDQPFANSNSSAITTWILSNHLKYLREGQYSRIRSRLVQLLTQ